MRKVIKYIVVTVTILSVLMSMMVIPAAAAESDAASEPSTVAETYPDGVENTDWSYFEGSWTFNESLTDTPTTAIYAEFLCDYYQGTQFIHLTFNYSSTHRALYYDYGTGANDYKLVVWNGTWLVDDAARTIRFNGMNMFNATCSTWFLDNTVPVDSTSKRYSSRLVTGRFDLTSGNPSLTDEFECYNYATSAYFTTLDSDIQYKGFKVESDSGYNTLYYYNDTISTPVYSSYSNQFISDDFKSIVFSGNFPIYGSVADLFFDLNYDPYVAPEPDDPVTPTTTYEGSYYYIYDYDEFWLDDTPDFSADVPGGFTCGADSSIVYNNISVSTPSSDSSQSRLIAFTRVDGTVDLVYSPEHLWYAEYYKQINFLSPLTISSSSPLSDFLTFNYTDVRPSYAPYFLDGEYRLSALPDWRSLLGIYSISGGVYYVSSLPTGPDIPEYLDLPFKAYGSDYVSMHGSAPGVQVYKDNRWIDDDYRYISFDNVAVSASVYSWFNDINNAVLMDSEYQAGYNDGYNSGYDYGYNAGSSSSIGNNFFGDLLGGIGEGLSKVVLLEYPIGDTMVKVTVWSVFGTIVVIMIVVWLLKLIAGG